MPVYEYLCPNCGAFTALRPMAECRDSRPCPGCGRAAPRVLISAPALATMPAASRRAHAVNERASHEPGLASRQGAHVHGPGCGCGSSTRPGTTVTTADGAKGFPTKRPWMISH
jgi:putative FmdB family regulatory protein